MPKDVGFQDVFKWAPELPYDAQHLPAPTTHHFTKGHLPEIPPMATVDIAVTLWGSVPTTDVTDNLKQA